MSDFENDLCILLSDVARHMRTYGNQLAQQHGTTLAQLTILERLQREPDITQNELAAITELSSMTVARLVDRLEEFGQETGVPVFDTLPFFAGPSPATLVNAPFVDPHPNAEGHALLATGMARVLRAAGLLSSPSASRSRSLATLTGVR